MGLPAGHVTDVPGLSRNAQLKALGNGVVPQQAALALRLSGHLVPDGWVTSDDVKGGNNGKPARAYRWVTA